MKQFLFGAMVLFFACAFSSKVNAQKGYNIKVAVQGYDNDTCILGYHLGPKLYIKDTLTKRDNKGKWVFKGTEPLPGGLYFIYLKSENMYFDFLIPNEKEQQTISIKTKFDASRNLSKHLTIDGSNENSIFVAYMKTIAKQEENARAVQQKIGQEKDEAKKAKLQEEMETIIKAREKTQEELLVKHPKSLIANMVGATMQPKTPEGLDQMQRFYFYRDEFWKKYDWSDERLIRTPIFKDKLEFWTDKLTVQAPDSLIKAVDFVLDKALKGGNEKVFQYVAAEYLNKYAKSKVICMDAVYVFIGEKYYCSGQASWVDSAQLVKICENVQSLKPLQCGLYAPNIRLKKMDGNYISLYDVKAKFTAIYFWDPTCGNCSKTSAKLVPVYEQYKDKGFEIFGVCSKNWKELDQCKKKIDEKKMTFINTSEEAYPLAVAKKTYDLKANPYLILLDENKKILLKRIDPDQLKDILARELGGDEETLEEKEFNDNAPTERH